MAIITQSCTTLPTGSIDYAELVITSVGYSPNAPQNETCYPCYIRWLARYILSEFISRQNNGTISQMELSHKEINCDTLIYNIIIIKEWTFPDFHLYSVRNLLTSIVPHISKYFFTQTPLKKRIQVYCVKKFSCAIWVYHPSLTLVLSCWWYVQSKISQAFVFWSITWMFSDVFRYYPEFQNKFA